MTSTPNKGYPLQATGDNPGTWGVVVNNQMFSVVDLNLGGRLSLSVAGSSDVTLNSTQAQNLYQTYTGVLTGNISVIFPDAGGFYFVNNATSGAFTLTVKVSGGTGFVVPQGKTMLAFMNATTDDAQEVIDYITALEIGTATIGSISLTNPLGVTAGGTGAATLTNHGVLLGQGTSAVAATAAMTDGQLLVGQSSANPLPKTISGDVTVSAAGAVTIANSAVTTAKIADTNVTTAKIADANVTTVKIADNNVTLAKLATQSDKTLLANISGGAAVPTASGLSAIIDNIIGSTQGQILYRGASAWSALSPGTSGQFLQSQGAGANPQWATVSSSTGWPALANGSFSGATGSIVLTSYTSYRGLRIVLFNILPATDGSDLLCRFSTNGGSSYDSGSSDYAYSRNHVTTDGTNVPAGSSGSSSISIAASLNNSSTTGSNFIIDLLNQTSTATQTKILWAGVYVDTAADTAAYAITGSGMRNANQDTDAVQFRMSAGNIAGTYAVYGYA